MRKLLLLSLPLIFAVTAAHAQSSDAAEEKFTITTKKGRERKPIFAEFGYSALIMKPSSGESMAFNGVSLAFGFYFNPKLRLGFELGIGGHKGPKVAEFDYDKTVGSSTTHYTDGVVHRKFSAIPFLINFSYDLHFSPKISLRVGPVVGVTSLSDNYVFKPVPDNEDEMRKELRDDLGIADYSEAPFCYGVNAALRWKPFQRAAVEVGYKLMGNSEYLSWNNTTQSGTSHQINVIVGLLF